MVVVKSICLFVGFHNILNEGLEWPYPLYISLLFHGYIPNVHCFNMYKIHIKHVKTI